MTRIALSFAFIGCCLSLILTAGSAQADNLTTLSDVAPSLISIGGPSFVASEGDYRANGRELNGVDGNPPVYSSTLGWTMNATITPSVGDLSGGAKLIMEIGGTTNGTGLWLVNGVPTLALKSSIAGGNPAANAPTSLIANDLDLSDNAAAIYSSFGALSAGATYTVAASWDAGSRFTMAVQNDGTGAGVTQSATVTGARNGYNWHGNATFTLGNVFGVTGNYGGLSNAPGSPFDIAAAASFSGTFDDFQTLFWNEPSTLSVDVPQSVLTINVNRATGEVVLTNPTSASVTVDSYTLVGGRGGFDGGSGVAKELTVSGGGLLVLAANGGSQSLGNVWAKTPYSDVSAQINVVGGGAVNALVNYTGPEGAFGDYDGSGALDAGDWPTVLSGMLSDLRAQPGVVQYLSGDLTGDGQVNKADFRYFKQTYEASFGMGSFEQMFASVPEPGMLTLALLAAPTLLVVRQRKQRVGAGLLAGALVLFAGAAPSHAVTTLGVNLFTGDSPIAGGPDKYYGTVATAPGEFVLTSLLNGSPGSQLAMDDAQTLGGGLGVGQLPAAGPNVGFTRSINNNGVNSEAIRLDVPSAGFTGIAKIVVTNASPAVAGGSTIVISGFASDPLATGAGSISFAGGTLTWVAPVLDAPSLFEATASTLTLTNPSAVAPGSSLTFSNGVASAATNQFGLRAFELASDIQATTLRVDTRTGMVYLKPGAFNQDIDYLQINSAGNGLLASGYTGLGGAPGFPQGNGSATSTGWDQPPTNATSTSVKAEAFAFGSSVLSASGADIPLGAFYNTALDLRDLQLSFDFAADGRTSTIGGAFIEYFQSAGLTGDYNDDGAVNAADYTVWRDLSGQSGTLLPNRDPANSGVIGAADYASWTANYGATSVATSAAVPEPTTLLLGASLLLLATTRSARSERG